AQQFNFTIVNKHFENIQHIFNNNDIPFCNVFNFDEIGIQLGGGHKTNGKLFFFA
ncbi:hypothetical protein EV424DRAFT_1284807, partial [Suillus variegatus]